MRSLGKDLRVIEKIILKQISENYGVRCGLDSSASRKVPIADFFVNTVISQGSVQGGENP
jgi:hypothetical protein